MWIFTRYGFVSVVGARHKQGEPGQGVDPDLLMVRARTRRHLKALMKRFPEELGGREIREFDGTDYAFRIFVEKAVWARVLSGLAEEIFYGNFKDEVARYQGRAGEGYGAALHDVWSVMYGLQEE